MKREFKVGDRVTVSGWFRRPHPQSADFLRSAKGTVKSIDDLFEVTVELDNGDTSEVHVRQVRRLKPRAKAREFWVTARKSNPREIGIHHKDGLTRRDFNSEFEAILVREVRGKK